MFWIKSLFEFLGMILLFSTIWYYIWYFWVVPKDQRRGRNSAVAITLFSIVFIYSPYAYVNYNKMDSEYSRLKNEMEQQIEKSNQAAEKTAYEISILKNNIELERRAYKNIEWQFEQLKNSILNIDKNYLVKFFFELKRDLNSIRLYLKEKELLIVKLRKNCQHELTDHIRWEYINTSLTKLDHQDAFEVGNKRYASLYVALIQDQIRNLKSISESLFEELINLETEMQSLEKKSSDLYSQVNDFLSVNIATKN